MIRTKTNVYSGRNNYTSKIYVEVSQEMNDKENDQFIFVIQDYVIDEKQQKKIIYSNQIKMSYAERDALKDMIVGSNNIQGTESEVNKVLMPYALLYITNADPIYGTSANDWEIGTEPVIENAV